MVERLGRNELIRKIGQGGMAEVYLAQAELAQGLQKLVVVKKIHAAFSKSSHFARMFRSEAYTATQLNHPNIVQVFDYGKDGDQLYLEMEYVEGVDLMRVVKLAHRAGMRIPHGIGAYVLQELLKGLDYAHRKTGTAGEPMDIVHRDVSPQNVLISNDGAVKLVDFGIAKTRSQVEEEGVVKGKYAYMAPEQAAGQDVDRRCDIFAAGIILYELVTGRTLFGGLKGEAALQAVRAAEIPPPREVDPGVPPELEEIIVRSLARLPEDRYATARDFQHDLTRFLYRQEEIFDTAALAIFLSRIMPEEERGTAVLPSSQAMATGGAPIGNFEDSNLRAGGTRTETEPITERKKVLLVCGNFLLPGEGGDTGDRRNVEAIARFVDVAKDIIQIKYEVVMDRLQLGDGLTAVVGLPVAAEEDAIRSIDLCMALLDAFEATCEDTGAQAGLGFSITRGFASVERRRDGSFDYTISPELLQLGSLLASQAAKGQILVDDTVRKAAEEEWELEEIPLLSQQFQKAREEITAVTEPGSGSLPARVFRLDGRIEGARPLRPAAALVGRALEMKALQDAFWDIQRRQRGRVVVIYGDKGMGRRTLVRAFLSSLKDWEGQIIRMVARPSSRMAVHATLGEIALQLVTGGEPLSGEPLETRLEELATAVAKSDGYGEDAFVEPLRVLLGVTLRSQVKRPDPVDPDQLDHAIQETLYRLLRWRAQQRPLVLILENAHLASRLALKHVSDLARRFVNRPILAVLTARPSETDEDILEGLKVQPIHLGELGPDERRELAMQRFVDSAEAEVLVKQVVDRAGGNPYYIEAMLDSLVEQGICVQDEDDPEGRLRPKRRDAKLQLPASVESLVASRLDRLPAELRGVLRRAAVLGRVFDQSHLESLAGEPVGAVLQDLEKRRLIYSLNVGLERWSFAQQVIQEVAYSSMEPEEAASLHRVAAQALMQDLRYQPGAGDARVARQLQLAGRKQEAVAKYVSAARYARNVSGNREAYQLMTLALELDPTDPELVFGIHREREQILRGWGRRARQAEEIQKMQRLADSVGDPRLQAEARVRALRFENDGGRPNQVLQAFDDTMAAAVRSGDPLLQADALRLRARALNDLGRNDDAIDSVDKALRLVPGSRKGLRMRGELQHTRGNIQFYTGQPQEAVASFAEALAIFRKLGLKRLEATMLMNIGFVSQCLGEYEGALRYYQDAYNIDLAIGDRFYTGTKLANLGQAYTEMGQYDRAERYLWKALDLCRAVEDASGLADAVTTLGQLKLYQGKPAEAREHLREGIKLSQEAENAYGEMRARIYAGLARIEAGESPESALEEGDRAVELSRKADMPQGVVFGLMVQAKALLALGRVEDALARSAEAMSVVATGTPIVGVEETLHLHAQVLARLGRTAEARPFMQRALDEIRKKVRRFKQPDRARTFLASRVNEAILATYGRIVGPVDLMVSQS